jgi:hypothetical protein
MAQKRLFDRAIIETDKFLNISLSAKALYFLLGMEADDEGFVSPNRVMRLYGSELGDLKNLIDTGLVIPFKSGVVVITDWKENNWLDSRRIKPTQYQEELKLLKLDNNKYLLSECLAGAKREEYSIVEHSREEKSIEEEKCLAEKSIEEKKERKSSRFAPPSLQEVSEYIKANSYNVDANQWLDFYESKGWMVGKSPMKNWQAAVRTWAQRNIDKPRLDPLTELAKSLVREGVARYGDDDPGYHWAMNNFSRQTGIKNDGMLKYKHIFKL